ncbi:methylene-fatty-acyl-phospholipid synthase [Ceratobasidium sp. AG-Ba]|nr:methylene-fatty-acyl-phospholipid synthase [Ceratobasidium sp. AG-Ba]
MRLFGTIAAAFAGLVAAQSSGTATASAPIPTESLTPCIFTCSESAVQSAGCSSIIDVGCICADDGHFRNVTESCLLQQCPDQIPQANQYQQALCDAAGSTSASGTPSATLGTVTSSLAIVTDDPSSSVAHTSSVVAGASSLISSLSSAAAKFKQKVEREAGEAVHMPSGNGAKMLAGLMPWLCLFLLVLFALIAPQPVCSTRASDAVRVTASEGRHGVLRNTSRWMRTSLEPWRRHDLDIQHLGSQWNYIGVRERPKLVNTGPYALVRHPMYTAVAFYWRTRTPQTSLKRAHARPYPMYSFGILMDLVSAVMYWNWIPLAGAALTTVAFAIKIPMEEKLILNKKVLGDDYKQYRREVPSRIIPYIW